MILYGAIIPWHWLTMESKNKHVKGGTLALTQVGLTCKIQEDILLLDIVFINK